MFNYMPNTCMMFENQLNILELRRAQTAKWLQSGGMLRVDKHVCTNSQFKLEHNLTRSSAFAHDDDTLMANDQREWLYSVQILRPNIQGPNENRDVNIVSCIPQVVVGKSCYICHDPHCPNINWVGKTQKWNLCRPETHKQQFYTQSLNLEDTNGNFSDYPKNCMNNRKTIDYPGTVLHRTGCDENVSQEIQKTAFTNRDKKLISPCSKKLKSYTNTGHISYILNSTNADASVEHNVDMCIGDNSMDISEKSFVSAKSSLDDISTVGNNTNSALKKSTDSKLYHSHIFERSVEVADDMPHTVVASSSVEHTSYGSSDSNSPPYNLNNNFMNVCNIFWRPRLSFNPFKFGDPILSFTSLWPPEATLKQLVTDAFEGIEFRRNVLDMCKVALRCGPVRLLKCLLDLKIIDIDQVFEDGSGMLHIACIARNFDAVLYLCNAGISPKIRDQFGHTADQVCFCSKLRKLLPQRYILSGPIMQLRSTKALIRPNKQDIASIFQLFDSTRNIDELMKKLQTFEVDVNRECNNAGDYLLHLTVNEGISLMPLALFLVHSLSADIDLCNGCGMTPLMIAAAHGDDILCDVLICLCGANPNVPNSHNKQTALHYACSSNSTEVISCLIKRGACFNLEDVDGRRPDDICQQEGSEVCREIIEYERQQRMAHLTFRIKQGEIFPSDLHVTDLYAIDDKHRTLIMVAATYNRVENLMALLNIEGAPINAQHAKTGSTALAIACISQSKEAVQVLMEHGANHKIASINGFLPMHYAIMEENDAIVDLLLQYFPHTFTKLQLALSLCKSSSMQYKITQAITRRQEEIVMPELFDCSLTGDAYRLYDMLDEGDIINSKRGINPLLVAVENGHLDVVKLLYENGGDIGCRHPTTRGTVLHAASRLGHSDMMEFLLQFCRPSCIRSQGGHVTHGHHNGSDSHYKELDVNSQNVDGKTCLQLAAEKGAGYMKIVRMLLDHGATTALLDETGNLFTSPDYEGVRMLIQSYREAHTNLIMRSIADKQRGLLRLKQHWQSPYDHNLRSKEGDTPLMVASKVNHVATVKFLLRSAVYKSKRLHNSDMESPKSDWIGGVLAPLSDDVFYDSYSYQTRSTSKCTTSLSNVAPSHAAAYDSETTDDRLLSHSMSAILPTDSNKSSKQLDFQRFMIDVHLPRGLYIYQIGRVCHANAVNLNDGSTALHRAVEGADNPTIVLLLLRCDSTSINLQNDAGFTPLHLAAKLGRKRILEKILFRKDIDVHMPTKNHEDLESLATNKALRKLIKKARHLHPIRFIGMIKMLISLYKLSGIEDADSVDPLDLSVHNSDWRMHDKAQQNATLVRSHSVASKTGTTIDLDKIGEQFKILKKKHQAGQSYVDNR